MKSRRDANFFLKFRQQGNFFLLQCGAVFGLPWTITPTTSPSTLLCYISLLSGYRAQYKCYFWPEKSLYISVSGWCNIQRVQYKWQGSSIGQQNLPQTFLHYMNIARWTVQNRNCVIIVFSLLV